MRTSKSNNAQRDPSYLIWVSGHIDKFQGSMEIGKERHKGLDASTCFVVFPVLYVLADNYLKSV